VIVNISDQQTALKISADQVRRLVQHVIQAEGQTCDEVNVYFVDTPTICQLHEQFFQDPSPTDCISFPIDEEQGKEGEFRLLGEIFVCPAAAIDYAARHEGNAYEETTLYIIHSLLHLMGYDDIDEKETSRMRQAEERHMHQLYSLGLQLQLSY
jgi:probable rRNA maturation factor